MESKPLNSPTQAIVTPSPALSQSSTVFESTPRPPRQRATFARLASVDDGKYTAIKDHEDDIAEASPYNDDSAITAKGLGIVFSNDSRPQYSAAPSTADLKDGFDVESHELGPWGSKSALKQSVSSFQSALRQDTAYVSDSQRLRNRKSFAESLRMVYDDFGPTESCAAHQHFHHGRRNWLSITILILAIYSTVMSGIFLILAFHKQRYGWIRKHGIISPGDASLLSAFIAKTIELSFATVFVSFLGQVLSRRAFMKQHGKGVTLAEMDMRSWVMQPGTMITHFEALKTSIVSFLGLLSLVAAVVAMLYTTASDSLVQPQLQYGPWQDRTIQGKVKTVFANVAYLGENCATPIPATLDPIKGSTCMQIQYAAQGYHNYQRYISDWSVVAANGNGSSDITQRPKGFAMLYENTTVTAPWIDIEESDVAAKYEQHNRIINNVTLALPHSGVPAAARDAINDILQPEDSEGESNYNLRASVPSPAVNVLCANMNETELMPLTYKGVTNLTLNATEWPTGEPIAWYGPTNYSIKTPVDDIFEWGEKYSMPAPIFPRLPAAYNTLLNHTGAYGRQAIYFLGQDAIGTYSLCAIKVFQTPFCSTEYNASRVGASLEAKCSNENENGHKRDLRYIGSVNNATSGNDTVSKDWPTIGQEWSNSLSLNAGITDGNASNARLLAELILKTEKLDAAKPSLAEALAVLASCTLLMSWSDAPFVQFWNYSSTSLENGQYQIFNASLRAQDYASGGPGKGPTQAFYIVLFAVFIINVVCLAYFISQNGLVTDFSEPLNLFSLAVNSPPSDLMAGSCAAGPKGKQYRAAWFVNAAGEHFYMENKADNEEAVPTKTGRVMTDFLPPTSPLRTAYEKMSRRKSWF